MRTDRVRWLTSAGAAGLASARCGGCHYFHDDPQVIERSDRGLAALSSGFAALRAGDGLCMRHQRYVAPRSACASFLARAHAR